MLAAGRRPPLFGYRCWTHWTHRYCANRRAFDRAPAREFTRQHTRTADSHTTPRGRPRVDEPHVPATRYPPGNRASSVILRIVILEPEFLGPWARRSVQVSRGSSDKSQRSRLPDGCPPPHQPFRTLRPEVVPWLTANPRSPRGTSRTRAAVALRTHKRDGWKKRLAS